jgi:hypothetical protein
LRNQLTDFRPFGSDVLKQEKNQISPTTKYNFKAIEGVERRVKKMKNDKKIRTFPIAPSPSKQACLYLG